MSAPSSRQRYRRGTEKVRTLKTMPNHVVNIRSKNNSFFYHKSAELSHLHTYKRCAVINRKKFDLVIVNMFLFLQSRHCVRYTQNNNRVLQLDNIFMVSTANVTYKGNYL